MRLRSNEVCPVHRSTSCCGREILPKPKLVRLGVQRVEDPHHPRGPHERRLSATWSVPDVCRIAARANPHFACQVIVRRTILVPALEKYKELVQHHRSRLTLRTYHVSSDPRVR